MSSSKLPCSTRGSISTHNRPLANFPPDVWGDIFLHPSKMYVDGETQLQHEELKEEVRRMIRVDVGDDLLHKLRLIDTVKRLGVSYHFEREIKEALHCVHEHPYQYDQTLEATSLRFRLLRESGFNASCETFNKFKDDEGSFSKSLTSDVKGLLELYEAAHLLVHGEHILQEALAFTTTHLELAKATGIVEYPLSALVSNALYLPLRKALPRWWKDLDFASKLPFARDRMVELYFWMLGMYFEPIYSFAREILTKVVSLISIMDDIYDSYGTFEELQLFRDAIQRWNDDCVDRLPDYMKLFYNLLLNIYKEIEEAMTKQGQPYRVQHSINKFKQLSDSYFAEAKWYNENHVPTMEEYMRVSLKSAATAPIIVTSLVGMENELTPEIFNWASDDPKIIVACAIQGRLEDDIASHKFEQERGHCASAVECYMREHGVSEEKACIELKKQVDNAWKDINYEMIFSETSKVVPVSVLTRVLNLTRATEFMYLAGDGYTHVGKSTKDGITSLLIDPISVSASGN
ncbi:Delta-cadinene synthase isozyme A [Hibiscus syriacus]|uniref:(+)-delta-cadinene synthase n=1 Tax=Hibiscus syriacus TaxID=106335 RepID=A0A6A2YXZ8_HIBSY|nr:Delta-cadinene synthase isozyme A [Hibiscus syriacus]